MFSLFCYKDNDIMKNVCIHVKCDKSKRKCRYIRKILLLLNLIYNAGNINILGVDLLLSVYDIFLWAALSGENFFIFIWVIFLLYFINHDNFMLV